MGQYTLLKEIIILTYYIVCQRKKNNKKITKKKNNKKKPQNHLEKQLDEKQDAVNISNQQTDKKPVIAIDEDPQVQLHQSKELTKDFLIGELNKIME